MNTGTPNCAVCGRECKDKVAVYTAERAATHFCPPARDPVRHGRLLHCIRRLWGTETCKIRRCSNCGFGFADPYVAGDEEFYAILHEQAGYPGWKWDFDIGLSVAREVGGGRALDVGAGFGAFLTALPAGWSRAAVEGSEATRSALRGAGVEVFPDLASAHASGRKFDLITLFQVLEHLAPFRPVLDRCRDLMTESGRLVVVVPDGDAMGRQERVTGCPDMPPNHVNRWTPDSLGRALADAGFRVGSTARQPRHWKKVAELAYLRVLADSARPGSLANRAYRIRRKPVRGTLLRALGIPALVRMLPRAARWPLSGSFAVTATTATGDR